jgi:hypothetical protein
LCSLRAPNFQVQRLSQKLVNLLKTRTCRNCGNREKERERERERVHRTAECSKVVLKTNIHKVIKTLQSRHSKNLQYSPETKTSSEAFEKTASSWPKNSRTNKNLNSDLEHERSTSSEQNLVREFLPAAVEVESYPWTRSRPNWSKRPRFQDFEKLLQHT